MYDGMPELEDCDDVVVDLLVNQPQIISFISYYLETESVADSSILPPGENDMYNGMPDVGVAI